MQLVPFEIQVLRLLLADRVSESEWNRILAVHEIRGYEFTGAGYFLELKCRIIDFGLETIHQPTVLGKVADLEVGFLLFLDHDSLTIECHGWGENDPPPDIRQLDLEIWSEP